MRAMTVMIRPMGRRNLFLLLGSDSILDRM
jgi:hypothetical protein